MQALVLVVITTTLGGASVALAAEQSGESRCIEHDFALTPDDVEPLRGALSAYPQLAFDAPLRESRTTLTCERKVRFHADLAPHEEGAHHRREYSIECLRSLTNTAWQCATPGLHTQLLVDRDEVELLEGDLAEALTALRFAREALVSALGVRTPWDDRRIRSNADFRWIRFVPGVGWEIATHEAIITIRRRQDGEFDVTGTRRIGASD